MDTAFDIQARDNTVQFKRSLDRIIEKYSGLRYHGGGIEVDLMDTRADMMEQYMSTSEMELQTLEEKSQMDLRDSSLSSHNATRDTQLDLTQQVVGADDTCVSSQFSTQFSAEEVDEMSTSSWDEGCRDLSEAELQPEDQDEELEMLLRSHSGLLVALFPDIIGRLQRAWNRHRIVEAANSVLRRYHSRRRQANREYLNNTFTFRLPPGNPKKMTSKESSGRPVKATATPQYPLQTVTNAQSWNIQSESTMRGRGLLRRAQHQTIFGMDRSRSSEPVEHKKISLNETFDVSEEGEQPFHYACSLSRPLQPSTKAFSEQSLRPRFLSSPAPQNGESSLFVSQTAAVHKRADSHSSPVRRSPLKARIEAVESRSPLAFSRSPRSYPVAGSSRELLRPRSTSISLFSPPHRPTVSQRSLFQEDPYVSLRSQLPPPQSPTAAGRPRLRGSLSFDSSLPSVHISFSPQKIDEDFVKLYHRVVCQNSPFTLGMPLCRFCGRSSEARRSPSSSALAALALSPHRSLLRKRPSEVDGATRSETKRLRDQYYMPSPGSKRYTKEMLRHRLSESKPPVVGLCHSQTRRSLLPRFFSQEPPADKHLDSRMSRAHNDPAAELSGLGGSQERKGADGYSPRKW